MRNTLSNYKNGYDLVWIMTQYTKSFISFKCYLIDASENIVLSRFFIVDSGSVYNDYFSIEKISAQNLYENINKYMTDFDVF